MAPIALITLLAILGGLADASLPMPPATASRGTGRIAGSVEITAALTARRPNFRIYADARSPVQPRVPANELASEVQNVLVYLEGDSAAPLPDTLRSAFMAQAGEKFEPRVLPVAVGSRVEFPNYDDVYHNVFSLSRARTFDLGRYPKGASRSVTFGRSGIVQVFCHIHADMSGVVFVLANQHFAKPDSTGRFSIDNVPPGEYTLVGWHERTKPTQYRIRVVAGETSTVYLKLPLSTATP